jgi:hypothetical protein
MDEEYGILIGSGLVLIAITYIIHLVELIFVQKELNHTD